MHKDLFFSIYNAKDEEELLDVISSSPKVFVDSKGKYNMGSGGAIVFCGKKRCQLIASKRFTNDDEFGFTLVREHLKKESDNAKETWYE